VVIGATFLLGNSQLGEKMVIRQQNFGLGLGSVLELKIFIFYAIVCRPIGESPDKLGE